jgi:hypothetical protein
VQAAQGFRAPELLLSYYSAWQHSCLANNNFTDECSLDVFNGDILPQWPEAALKAANTSRQVRCCSRERCSSFCRCQFLAILQACKRVNRLSQSSVGKVLEGAYGLSASLWGRASAFRERVAHVIQ